MDQATPGCRQETVARRKLQLDAYYLVRRRTVRLMASVMSGG